MPNLLDGCPIDDGADYTIVGAQNLSTALPLLCPHSSMYCSVFYLPFHYSCQTLLWSGGHTAAAQLSSDYF